LLGLAVLAFDEAALRRKGIDIATIVAAADAAEPVPAS
jgi:hypothetical protein